MRGEAATAAMRLNGFVALGVLLLAVSSAAGQVPPSSAELQSYQGLFAASATGDAAEIERLVRAGAMLEARDSHGRTPLLVAAHLGHRAVARALLDAGANPQRHGRAALRSPHRRRGPERRGHDRPRRGGRGQPGGDHQPLHRTALIAAAHLGHFDAVRTLIEAGAPLDHVNNLGWTALIEAIVLGDGGPRHLAVVRSLVGAGASLDIVDRQGRTPAALAAQRGHTEMAQVLAEAAATRRRR
jgi:ankyrin repeat protein